MRCGHRVPEGRRALAARRLVDNFEAVLAIVMKTRPKVARNPVGTLVDAELQFTDGALEGLKLIGFDISERRTCGGRNGDRRSFALLRPIADASVRRIRELVLRAYAELESREVG